MYRILFLFGFALNTVLNTFADAANSRRRKTKFLRNLCKGVALLPASINALIPLSKIKPWRIGIDTSIKERPPQVFNNFSSLLLEVSGGFQTVKHTINFSFSFFHPQGILAFCRI